MTTTTAAPRMALAAARGLELSWAVPGLRRRVLTLSAGEHEIATLSMGHGRSTPAQGAFAEGEWTIEKRGLWRTAITVKEPGRDVDVARMEMSMWGGGLVDFPRGGQFRWGSAGFGRRRMFASYGGDPLVRLRYRVSLRRRAIGVDVDPSAWSLRELPVLLLLGAYLMESPARAG